MKQIKLELKESLRIEDGKTQGETIAQWIRVLVAGEDAEARLVPEEQIALFSLLRKVEHAEDGEVIELSNIEYSVIASRLIQAVLPAKFNSMYVELRSLLGL